MKKHIQVIVPAVLAAVLLLSLFTACPNPTVSTPEPSPDRKTWVCFDNPNGFKVSIYRDSSRQVKLTDVEARGKSDPVQIDPNSSGAQFYPTYRIIIEEMDIPYEGHEIIARVDAGKSQEQPNVVTVPALSQLGEEELSKPLTSAVYLKIQNAGTVSLVLRRGSTEEYPQGSNSSILNGGETGLYTISPGPVSAYSLRENTTIHVDFPPAMTEFVSGHFYSLRFDGNTLVLAADIPLTLAQVYTRLPAPTGISASAQSASSITISWYSVSGADSYRIYRATTSTGTYERIGASSVITGTSYTDTGLPGLTTYYYKVVAYSNISGEGPLSTYSYARTLTPLPPPSWVSASAQSASSIIVWWDSVSGADSYTLYRSETSTGTYERIGASSAITGTSYTDTGLSGETTYYYKVRAYSYSQGEGDYSEAAPAETLTPLPAPGNVNATVNSSSSITITWSSVSGADSYALYRSETSTGTYERVDAGSTITGTSYTDTGLSGGTTYYYKVRAYSYTMGEGNYSEAASAATRASLPAPAGITAAAQSSSSILISWSAVPGAEGYHVYRSTGRTGPYLSITGTGITATSYTDDAALSPGTTYYYRVAGYSDSTDSILSSSISATTLLSTPSSVSALEQSASSITVRWDSVSGADSYRIYRSTNSTGPYERVGTDSIITGTSYTDTGLSGSTTYYYKVAAYNDTAREGILSSAASATTLIPLPAPTETSASAASTSSITVSWNSVSDADSYRVYRSTSSTTNYTLVCSTDYSWSISYTDTGLSASTTYYYKVAAYNSTSGEGNYSVPTSATTLTPLPAPTGVSAAAQAASSITVRWDSVSGADSYRVYRSEISTGDYTWLTSTGSTSYTDDGLSASTMYYYKVAAYNSTLEEGDLSTYTSAITLLSAPLSVSASPQSSSSIRITWSFVSGAVSYRIYRSTSSTGDYEQTGGGSAITGTSYTDTGLQGSTTYYYKVAAYNSISGEGGLSAYNYATTPAALSIPTGVSASATSASSITVSWNSVTDASYYYIYRSDNSTGDYTLLTSTSSTSYIDTGLLGSTTYYYKVAAYNSVSGEGGLSSDTSATTLLSAPSSVTATAQSSSSIRITWTSVSGATSYFVYRSTTSAGENEVEIMVSSTSFTDTGLSAGTTYYYKVAAVNLSGTSALSSYATATTSW